MEPGAEGAAHMNSKQRRKARRKINPHMSAFQRAVYAGIEAGRRMDKWLWKNPLGSKNNPYIVSPHVYALLMKHVEQTSTA